MESESNFLVLWEIKKLWNKTTEEIADYILNYGLRAYTHAKVLITPKDLQKLSHHENRVVGINPLTGARSTRQFPVFRKGRPDEIMPYVKYFDYDDIVDFSRDQSLPTPETTIIDEHAARKAIASRSSADKLSAISAAEDYLKKSKEQGNTTLIEVVRKIRETKNVFKSENNYTEKTIKNWIRHLFDDDAKKSGRPKKK